MRWEAVAWRWRLRVDGGCVCVGWLGPGSCCLGAFGRVHLLLFVGGVLSGALIGCFLCSWLHCLWRGGGGRFPELCVFVSCWRGGGVCPGTSLNGGWDGAVVVAVLGGGVG